jgi:enoyl-CoA hydratase
MTYENLKIEISDGIAVVTISREKALNALNSQTIGELIQFFSKDAHEIEELKGVILTGAGEKAFVAGADITEFKGLSSQEGAALAQRGQEAFFLIERFHRPVIAAVNGFALGGGCELAMACHLRVAGEKAKFGQPEVNLGLIPGYGGTQRLIQYIGKTKAMELMMTANIIGADEAHQLGLVNQIVPLGAEIEKSKELLLQIASKAPIAISKVIETVNAYYDERVNGFQKEIDAFGACCNTDDFKEGASAFLEKRAPQFKGK